MISYWGAVIRRGAVGLAALVVLCGGAMAGVMIWDDATAWVAALLQGTLFGLAVAAVLAVAGSASNVWQAARMASRHGLTLSPEAVPLPCTAEIRVPIRPGTTAYELTDRVLHALKPLPAPYIEKVTEFTHGELTVICRGRLSLPVRFHVSITTDGDTATVTMDARPKATWKVLDEGSSWCVLKTFEPYVGKAVQDQADGASAGT
ncbi:hypothetical protein ACF09J_06395 [Streptomyces sp. NPDC014889]|uniref:hypothetical protein n=1 Tax=Streptomyces sp. NPDC014889 TaxID=3364928 RepID=UPI003701E490